MKGLHKNSLIVKDAHPINIISAFSQTEKNMMKFNVHNLYGEIDDCISQIIKGRAERNEIMIANAHHKMESLMVQTQQLLTTISEVLFDE